MKHALVIGGRGTLGRAIAQELKRKSYAVEVLHRQNTDYSQAGLNKLAHQLKPKEGFDLIFCCIGALHSDTLAPEKRLSQISESVLVEYFHINSVLPMLCMQAFLPRLKRTTDCSSFVCLSAMVGSIADNQLGGWYGYRSSKAALNMLVKTASLELRRTHQQAALIAMHPGTTRGPLSQPFSSRVAPDKYYLPTQSAARIVTVAETLSANNNGQFLNWDGQEIPW